VFLYVILHDTLQEVVLWLGGWMRDLQPLNVKAPLVNEILCMDTAWGAQECSNEH
jgi:hypothetical protein